MRIKRVSQLLLAVRERKMSIDERTDIRIYYPVSQILVLNFKFLLFLLRGFDILSSIMRASTSADCLKGKGSISEFSQGTTYHWNLLRICDLIMKFDWKDNGIASEKFSVKVSWIIEDSNSFQIDQMTFLLRWFLEFS